MTKYFERCQKDPRSKTSRTTLFTNLNRQKKKIFHGNERIPKNVEEISKDLQVVLFLESLRIFGEYQGISKNPNTQTKTNRFRIFR